MPERKPLVLVIFDGWGYSESPHANAIHKARKPNWDRLWNAYPHALIRASGAEVGLPAEQMGNSEVGHLNLGAGRVVYQEFTRVSRAIKTGSFYSNQTLTDAVDQARDSDRAVHILGLLSPGGVHSHEEHIHAMVELAVKRGATRVYVHAFLDGRDTAPKSALESIRALEAKCQEVGGGRIASLIGRYYAMDRDHRWPRVQAAYDLMTRGAAEFRAPEAAAGLEAAYERGESDEFVQATAVVPPGEAPVEIVDGDVVVFMNYRSDRARQITRPFIDPDFDAFERAATPKLGAFVTLTEYSEDFDVPVAFPPERMTNVFGEYIAKLGLHQLRIAETEKYAHVTFFFNGGQEVPFDGEDRILVPSPNVATYDLQPQMSAPEVTDRLVEAIESGRYEVIICNYANPDMVGHTGNMEATVQAIEALDGCLGRVADAVRRTGGELLITADHGNAELMSNDETQQMHTAHTSNPVPFLYMGRAVEMEPTGALCDVAPTMLYLLDLPQPSEMNGRPLLRLVEEHAQPEARGA
ncbi:2,3-bisphosphoglycerate-independent phosphoglycerate mutase [Ectothiorhodospiraceae bacterium 2226]|nr:2,3-bisphosphoglycerate-independent phosphoglycerate mutase [Ectothiorhodospiraceae bacterium 2226]